MSRTLNEYLNNLIITARKISEIHLLNSKTSSVFCVFNLFIYCTRWFLKIVSCKNYLFRRAKSIQRPNARSKPLN